MLEQQFMTTTGILLYVLFGTFTAHGLRILDEKGGGGPHGCFTEFEIRVGAVLWPVTWVGSALIGFTLVAVYFLRRQGGSLGSKK